MANYPIPENPEYNENIRMLEDTDPASASQTFNPLFEQLIENTAAVKKTVDAGNFIEVEILETICENLELYKDNTTYTFTEPITLDPDGLYYLKYKHYSSNGYIYADSGGFTLFSRVQKDTVTWMSASPTYQILLTDSDITNTISSAHEGTTLSIYKVQINVLDQTLLGAIRSEGYKTVSSGSHSHAEGLNTKATGLYAHAEGRGTQAIGSYSHAECHETRASGNYAHSEGNGSVAMGLVSHAEGSNTKAYGNYSHTEGLNTYTGNKDDRTLGECAHTEGRGAIAEGGATHAEGYNTRASGFVSHVEGIVTVATGEASHAEGYGTIANNYSSHAGGKYNKGLDDGGSTTSTIGDVFVLGNGTSATARSNCFRVTYTGEVYGLSTFKTSGADYAEYFEWLDGNADAEDRVGYFVTLDGEKIKLANHGDYILGIVSGQPCIIGNADEDWLGRWEHDEFGRFVIEEVDTPVTELQTIETPILDEESNPTGEIIIEEKEVPTGEIIHGTRYKANPDYDYTQPYVERKDRKEWDAVGMMGVLAVRDDGTCEVNSFCQVADGGIATAATQYVPGQTYRVIKRVTDNIVKVVFR